MLQYPTPEGLAATLPTKNRSCQQQQQTMLLTALQKLTISPSDALTSSTFSNIQNPTGALTMLVNPAATLLPYTDTGRPVGNNVPHPPQQL